MSSSPNRKYSAPDNNEPWDLLIGQISAPHGLQGQLRVYPHTDFPERFADLDEVAVQAEHAPLRRVKILAAQVQGRRIILTLAEVKTREQAEALRGAKLFIPKSLAMPLGEDEYYHHQLLGLQVVTTAGEALGPITQILVTGANDVYETPLALIPAVKEYIREVDLEHGRMVVEARRGLKKRDE